MAKQTRSDREAAKAKLAEERARQAAVDRRRKVAFVVVGVVAVLAIGIAVALAVNTENKNSGAGSGATPAYVTTNGGGDAGGPDRAIGLSVFGRRLAMCLDDPSA